MKVIVSESLGLEYAWDVISSCEQNGMQAIADNQNNEILFYDPKNRQYCTNKDLMNADYSIHDVFTDKSVRDQVMKPTSGQGFEEFATKWDSLQKSDDQDVIKTKNCSMIRFGAHESGKPGIAGNRKSRKEFMDNKVERFRRKWKAPDDKDDYVDDFGDRVNGVEAEVSEGLDDTRDWSASEGEVEIMWTVDYPEFGIEAGDTDHFVVEYDDVAPDNDYDIEDNGLRDEICRLIGKEYPDLDFEPYDFDILNEREFWGVAEQNRAYPYDESDGEFETMADIDDEQIWSDVGIDDNDNVVEGIPNWATSYIMYGDDSRLTREEVAMVDKFVEDLEKDGLRLSHPILGSENEFNSYPAFGDSCDTVDWSCEVV